MTASVGRPWLRQKGTEPVASHDGGPTSAGPCDEAVLTLAVEGRLREGASRRRLIPKGRHDLMALRAATQGQTGA